MSYTNTWTLWCDAPECPNWTIGEGTERTITELRRHVHWYSRSGLDYCSLKCLATHYPEVAE